MPSIRLDAAQSRIAEVEVAKLVWEEYKYRHDLIWRLLFRITAAAIVLSIVPFTVSDPVRRAVGGWIDTLPPIAFVLVAVSHAFLVFEFKLFRPINDVYVMAQTRAVGQRVRPAPKTDWFKRMVYWYPAILELLVAIATVVAWSLPSVE